METVKESIAALSDSVNTKLNDFQRDLDKVSSNSPLTTASLAAEFMSFKSFIFSALNALQRQVELLGGEIDRLETRKRRKMLLLHGVPEEKAENTSAIVTALAADHLNLANFSSSSIKASYRLGRSLDQKPRPIVVKFTDTAVRDKVWFAKTKLKGTGYTQSEFLTRTRHQVFMEARQRFGISNCWTREGCIHIVTTDGERHKVETLSDLRSISNTQKSPIPEKSEAPKPAEHKQLALSRTKRTAKHK
ncbi:protein unc-13 homolog C-like [Melitaea cinxia]|uniref:protein unc-13 homolog C-like n=1 Tax=Melitaea cinxia TaxID=113334 RepID=UPI001E2734EF|nr:protein unc-13 homolog C-like [Melitaea cinxia]